MLPLYTANQENLRIAHKNTWIGMKEVNFILSPIEKIYVKYKIKCSLEVGLLLRRPEGSNPI